LPAPIWMPRRLKQGKSLLAFGKVWSIRPATLPNTERLLYRRHDARGFDQRFRRRFAGMCGPQLSCNWEMLADHTATKTRESAELPATEARDRPRPGARSMMRAQSEICRQMNGRSSRVTQNARAGDRVSGRPLASATSACQSRVGDESNDGGLNLSEHQPMKTLMPNIARRALSFRCRRSQ